MGFFNCRVCLSQDQYGNCKTDATVCVTMRKFNPKCTGYQPLCNPLAGAFVASTTVCQQSLFTGSEATTQARTVVQAYSFTVSSANATVGAIYSAGTLQFKVVSTIAAGTTLIATLNGGVGILTGTTLTKVSGVGDATITFSAAYPNGVQTVAYVPVGGVSPYNGQPIISSCSDLVSLTDLSPLDSSSVVYT